MNFVPHRKQKNLKLRNNENVAKINYKKLKKQLKI